MDDFNFAGIRPGETFRKNQINVINCWQEDTQIEIGAVTEQGGRFAGLSLDQATKDLKEGIIDALVTAPIHKKAMQLSGFRFPGHTEFLTHAFDTKESLMLMCSENLKVGLVTNHVPVSEVAPLITRERLKNKLSIFNRTLKIDFGMVTMGSSERKRKKSSLPSLLRLKNRELVQWDHIRLMAFLVMEHIENSMEYSLCTMIKDLFLSKLYLLVMVSTLQLD